MEKSTSHFDQVNLVFTSQGVPIDEEEILGGLEVVIRVKFKSGQRRDEFLDMIMRTQATLTASYDGM